MLRGLRSLALVGLPFAFACSAPSSTGPGVDGGGDGGGACGVLECPASACGFSVDACERLLDCSCAYSASQFLVGSPFDVTSAGDEVLVVNTTEARLLRGGAWVATPIAPGVLPPGSTFLAASPGASGQVWVVAGSQSSATVASDADGGFAVELDLPGPLVAADVAVLADGTVGVVSGGVNSVSLRTRAPGAAWQTETLATLSGSVLVAGVALAAGTDGFWVLWVDTNGVVSARDPRGVTQALAEREASGLVSRGRRLAVAAGRDGAPHLVFRGTSGLAYATNDGAWVVSTLPRFAFGATSYAIGSGDLDLAAGPDGTVSMATGSSYFGNVLGVSVAQLVGGRWFAQPVVGDGRCDEDTRLGLAVTSRGAFVGTSCGRAVERTGRLAPGFRETCLAAVEAASRRAQECSADAGTSMTCTRHSGAYGSGRFCGSNARLTAAFCGDPSRSVTELTECSASLAVADCVDAANALGLTCSSFFAPASP